MHRTFGRLGILRRRLGLLRRRLGRLGLLLRRRLGRLGLLRRLVRRDRRLCREPVRLEVGLEERRQCRVEQRNL